MKLITIFIVAIYAIPINTDLRIELQRVDFHMKRIFHVHDVVPGDSIDIVKSTITYRCDPSTVIKNLEKSSMLFCTFEDKITVFEYTPKYYFVYKGKVDMQKYIFVFDGNDEIQFEIALDSRDMVTEITDSKIGEISLYSIEADNILLEIVTDLKRVNCELKNENILILRDYPDWEN